MLYDIQPAPELLGGVWHTEQDLDQDFVNTMSMAAMYQLRKLVRLHLSPTSSSF